MLSDISDISDPGAPIDGRRARRERSRAAVIDAVFGLIDDGKVPPSVEQVAERSGVSVSSIFRMFDGLDDMRRHAFEEFEVRYSHLLKVDFDDSATRSDRIERLVGARTELYAAAGSLMAMARQRALDHEPIANRVGAQRVLLAEQTQQCLRAETRALTPTVAANLVALVDATTSPESFELLRASHARTRRQIERTWRRAVAALVADWCDDTSVSNTGTSNTGTSNTRTTNTRNEGALA
jgi:DNA-binding transcriptional regulator YbjK